MGRKGSFAAGSFALGVLLGTGNNSGWIALRKCLVLDWQAGAYGYEVTGSQSIILRYLNVVT